MEYIIATDSNCDLPLSYITTHNIPIFHITANLEGQEIIDDLGASYSHHDFYDKLRKGSMPTTSQVNMYTFKEQFTKWIQAGIPILYIAFSSNLSGTYNNAILAKDELLQEYPDAQITVIDSLCASGGLGMLVYKAYEMKNFGASLEEIIHMVYEYKDRIFHIFTVDDLHHLERGGRVSQLSAFVGTLLKIKPVLHVNPSGQLIPCQKTHGRKKALHTLTHYYETKCIDKNHFVMITHGDSLSDANFVADELRDKYGVKDIIISNIGTGVGAHSGPDTIALFFISTNKEI